MICLWFPRLVGRESQALLAKAAQVGRAQDAVRLALSAARTNDSAQRLYESQGWIRDDIFLYYTLTP